MNFNKNDKNCAFESTNFLNHLKNINNVNELTWGLTHIIRKKRSVKGG